MNPFLRGFIDQCKPQIYENALKECQEFLGGLIACCILIIIPTIIILGIFYYIIL